MATTTRMTVDRFILGPPRLDLGGEAIQRSIRRGRSGRRQRRCRESTTPRVKHVNVLSQLSLDGPGRWHIYSAIPMPGQPAGCPVRPPVVLDVLPEPERS